MDNLFRKHFSVLESRSPEMKTFGFRVLALSGDILRDCSDSFVERLKLSLPSDAAIFAMDGLIFRMRQRSGSYGSDQFCIVFGSSEWDKLAPGSEFPLLEIEWIETAPKNDEIAHRYQLSRFSGGTYEIVIDKATQSFEIPRDRETESQLVIVVRSK